MTKNQATAHAKRKHLLQLRRNRKHKIILLDKVAEKRRKKLEKKLDS
jgi:hypothetical protein